MKVIGIGGFARAGKDTFVKIACDILKKNGYNPIRIAFADILKEEVDEMLKANNFKLDVYTNDPEEKAKIRPLLVWWGCTRRTLSPDGLYWIDYIEQTMGDYINDGTNPEKKVFLISDVRFPNEAKWIHENWSGWFIHLKRYTIVPDDDRPMGFPLAAWKAGGFPKEYDIAPNDEEAIQDPLIQDQ